MIIGLGQVKVLALATDATGVAMLFSVFNVESGGCVGR